MNRGWYIASLSAMFMTGYLTSQTLNDRYANQYPKGDIDGVNTFEESGPSSSPPIQTKAEAGTLAPRWQSMASPPEPRHQPKRPPVRPWRNTTDPAPIAPGPVDKVADQATEQELAFPELLMTDAEDDAAAWAEEQVANEIADELDRLEHAHGPADQNLEIVDDSTMVTDDAQSEEQRLDMEAEIETEMAGIQLTTSVDQDIAHLYLMPTERSSMVLNEFELEGYRLDMELAIEIEMEQQEMIRQGGNPSNLY